MRVYQYPVENLSNLIKSIYQVVHKVFPLLFCGVDLSMVILAGRSLRIASQRLLFIGQCLPYAVKYSASLPCDLRCLSNEKNPGMWAFFPNEVPIYCCNFFLGWSICIHSIFY